MSQNATETVSPKIITRIQALMRLANNNPSENEALAASNEVQRLLSLYNLELSTVEAAGNKNVADSGSERVKKESKGKAMYQWQRKLMEAVAALNYCFYRTDTSSTWKNDKYVSSPHHFIVGRQVNVMSALLMFDYLCETIEKLVPIANNAQRLSKSAMSWKEGCADRLVDRLNDKRWTREYEQTVAVSNASKTTNDAGSTAMTLASMSNNERDLNWEVAHNQPIGTLAKWRAEREMRASVVTVEVELSDKQKAEQQARWNKEDQKRREKDARMWAKKDMEAYYAGAEAGRKIGLDTQVEGKEQKQLA